MAQPGIANDFNDESAKKYYTYYQWVCFALFFQVSRGVANSEASRSIMQMICMCVCMFVIVMVQRSARALRNWHKHKS